MKRKTKIDFINQSKKIHGDKFNYLLVDYKNNKTKVKIICKEHGVFEQIPQNHLKGQGCVKCKMIFDTDGFIKKSNKIHNKYNYSLVNYKDTYTKVKIICKEHGVFEQRPNDHLNGHGCPMCANNIKKTIKEFIDESNIIHNNKYNYSLVDYKNNKNKVKIICKEHGEFTQKPNDHLNGLGCPKCGKTKRLTKEEFIDCSNIIHNNKYNYSLVDYKNNKTKVKIICPIHGIFEQRPLHHMNNIGCPKCNESKGEKKIRKILENKNIKYKTQKTFDRCKYKRKLKFDFYLPDYNVCIEYDGEQHTNKNHYFNIKNNYEKQKIKDDIKTKYCIDNKIKLIRINYLENIKNKLENIKNK